MTILAIFDRPELYFPVFPFFLVIGAVITIHKTSFADTEIGRHIKIPEGKDECNYPQDNPEWSPYMTLHKTSPKKSVRGIAPPLFSILSLLFYMSSSGLDEIHRISVFMTTRAFLFGLFFCYTPFMWFMTVDALHAHCFNMHFMFADIDNLSMAAYASTVIGANLRMRLMAFIAVELHRRIRREFYFDGLIDNFLIRFVVGNIHGRVRYQFLPD